jgi:murein DD-endopeptidase MepM/ murein hydrolase activator NlpD
MLSKYKAKNIVICELILLLIFSSVLVKQDFDRESTMYTSMYDSDKKFIKWVNFDVSPKAMDLAYKYDIDTYDSEVHLNWIELLAYLGSRYGGDFSRYKEKHMRDIANQLINKEKTIDDLTKDMKYYDYYYEAYSAVLSGMVGEYMIEVTDESNPGEKILEKNYGLKAFLPIAKYYPYSHFDDFGVSRSYGFKRKHLGHDMMGQVGTPVIAVESGYVEALGWNQYGGWRIGIRSFDKKRYYYYAHLRQNFPYNKSLEARSVVQAGDVIGYLGRTGYSSNENANNIRTPHLHFGIQLIFDESQKESIHEIWIDCYDIVQFLYKNRCETIKNPETKEYYRVNKFIDPVAEEYIKHQIYDYDDEDIGIHIYE